MRLWTKAIERHENEPRAMMMPLTVDGYAINQPIIPHKSTLGALGVNSPRRARLLFHLLILSPEAVIASPSSDLDFFWPYNMYRDVTKKPSLSSMLHQVAPILEGL